MTYQAPYAARYVSAAGNQIQLLNLWDDTPEPPRFGGSIEAFETSLVDGPRAFAQGLGSAVEQRTIAFYRWFTDYQDMASYQENLALWVSSNQNGYLYLQFADQPQWRFAAVITGYQFETENFIPPPSPEDGYLCLLVTLTMTVTDRTPDNSNWIFSVTPDSVSAPASGGQYTFSVESSFSPGAGKEPLGQGWQAVPGDGVTVSNVTNGNNGSFRVNVSPNGTTEERSLYVTVIQDGTGLTRLAEIIQEAASPQQRRLLPPSGNYTDNPMSYSSWRWIPSDVYPDFPAGTAVTLLEIATTNPTSVNSGTLTLYRVENGSASLLATSSEAVSTGEGGNVKWTFSPGVEIRSDWQLVVENQNSIFEQHAMLSHPQAFDGLGNAIYPMPADAPGRTFGLSLLVSYVSM